MTGSLPVHGSLLVQGGDEFHDACRPMDRVLLGQAGDGLTVIYPGASEEHFEAQAAENAANYYRSLGADVQIAPTEPRAAAAAMAPARTVILPGGSPARLLDRLEAEGGLLADTLRGILLGGGAVSGSSAGAMVLGSLVWLPEHERAVPGLGLLPWLILPHADSSPSRWLAIAPLAHAIDAQTRCLALAEHSGLLLTEGREETFGDHWRWE